MAAETACPDGGGTDDLDTRDAAVTDIEQLDTGIEGMVGGGRILAGTLELFKRRDWTVSDTIERRAAEARDIGQLPVVVGRDGRAGGLIIVGDEPRSEWDDVLSRLGTDDRTIVVLTGDDSEAVDRFDGHFAVDHAFASIPPAGKTATIDRLGQQGTVAMIGDGTNDAAALAAADLGISLGSGTALAADAADLAIIDDDLRSVDTAFALSAATRRRVRQNTALAVCYNAVTIPLAIGGWFNPVTAMAAVVLTGGLLGYNSVRPMAGVG
jgi:P-type E1-E2 ATPase